MKILHLLQSNHFSGAENVVCQIIGMFKDEPNVEMAYCSQDGSVREALRERGIAFYPMAELNKSEFKRVVDEYKPDVIHAHDRTAAVIAALVCGKIPVIVHMHVNNNKGFSLFVKNALWTLFSKKYKHIFWVSDSALDDFQFRGLVKKKSSVLYNVVDKQSLIERANADCEEYGYDAVYVGRLSHQKHPERLMNVFHNICKELPSVRIAIAGDGEYADYVKTYIAENELGANIDYLGYKKNPLKLIKQSKLLLMTSRFEGTPMVAIEAQLLGVPIVSTPVDGMRKIIVNGENGYLTDTDGELTKYAIDIISDEALHRKLSENAEKKAMPYADVENFKKTIGEKYHV